MVSSHGGDKGIYLWKKQQRSASCEHIHCQEYDTYADFQRDPSGYYILIQPDFEFYKINVAIVNASHVIERIYSGQFPQELYHTILKDEVRLQAKWFLSKSHIAYLGKELKKAEIALATGQANYFQE